MSDHLLIFKSKAFRMLIESPAIQQALTTSEAHGRASTWRHSSFIEIPPKYLSF